MDKQELLTLLREMIQSGQTESIVDLVETGVNEIVKDTQREVAAAAYDDGYRDGVREARAEQ